MNLEGRLLGNRYEIIEKIGNGGMATVYKANCHVLNRYVAVKILRDEFTTDDEFIKIKYKFTKALYLVVFSDDEAAKKEADETIKLLDKVQINYNDSFQLSTIANIHEMYYEFSGEKEYLHKS